MKLLDYFRLGVVTLPFNIRDGDGAFAAPVMANFNALATNFNVVVPLSFCDFRLSAVSGLGVPNSDQTGVTNIYLTPYKGNKISLFDSTGTSWNVRTSAEIAIPVPAVANQMYDVFAFDLNGVVAINLTPWTSDLSRATTLSLQNGVYVRTATGGYLRYLGSFRTTTVAGQTEDSAAKRYIWNYYNRVRRDMRVNIVGGTAYVYSTGVARQANNNAANQLDFVQGVAEDAITAQIGADVINTVSPAFYACFVGVNGIGTSNGDITPNGQFIGANIYTPIHTRWADYLNAGRNFLTWVETGSGSGVTTWNSISGLNCIQGEIFG